MMRSPEEKPVHWIREPWVWLLIGIPASSVVMGVVMITLAIQSYSGLVVDDYYRQGKEINRVLERDRAAWELGLGARLQLESGGRVRIDFDPAIDFIPADSIELQFVHATRPGLDQRLQLQRVGSHRWTGAVELSGQGRWNLILQTADWRITGSIRQPSSGNAFLLPNYYEE
jgi:hypothetical protein